MLEAALCSLQIAPRVSASLRKSVRQEKNHKRIENHKEIVVINQWSMRSFDRELERMI
jgi:hypothetical protein